MPREEAEVVKTMRHRIAHSLAPAQVREILDEALATHMQRYARYQPHLEWNDSRRAMFGFRVRGLAVTGTLTLAPGAIDIEAQVPWMLRPLLALALKKIEAEAERLLARPPARALPV